MSKTEAGRRVVHLHNTNHGFLWLLFWFLVLVPLMLSQMVKPLRESVAREREQTWAVADVVQFLFSWPQRSQTIFALILAVLLLYLLALAAYKVPRQLTRQEAEVTSTGIELRLLPWGWFRGDRMVIPLANVQLLRAAKAIFREGGKHRTDVPRDCLDIYLYEGGERRRPWPVRRTNSPASDDIPAPAIFLRIAGTGARGEQGVRELVGALGEVRPDLFHARSSDSPWEIPSTVPAPRLRARVGPGKPSLASPDGPVWIDYQRSLVRLLALLLGAVVLTVGSYWGTLAFQVWVEQGTAPEVLVGLLALPLMAGFVTGIVYVPFALWQLPRMRSPQGILVNSLGIEFVEKRSGTWREMVSWKVPWEDVQAIVSRTSHLAATDTKSKKIKPVLDIFLRGTGHFRVGVGIPIQISRQSEPETLGAQAVVDFPALRLRFGRSPRMKQFGAALLAFRPDLCYGFDDLT